MSVGQPAQRAEKTTVPPQIPSRPLTTTISVGSGSAANPTEDEAGREMPFTGWLAEMFIRWESGTNGLVGVRLEDGKPNQSGKKIIPFNPEDEFIALNDVSRLYSLWVPVEKGDPFTVRVQNQDSVAGHSVPMDMIAVKFVPEIHGALPPELLPDGVEVA